MNTYTLEQLTTLINSLLGRVNALDGQNLPSNQTGSVANILLQLNSIKTDLGQIAASFENELAVVNRAINNVQLQINTLSGVPNNQQQTP